MRGSAGAWRLCIPVAAALLVALAAGAERGDGDASAATAAHDRAAGPAKAARYRLPRRFGVRGRVGRVRLGARKNAVLRAWGIPTSVRRSGAYTKLRYGRRLAVSTNAHRVVAFDVRGRRARAKRGVTAGSSLKRWRRAYRRLRRGGDGIWLLDHPGGNLTALHVESGRVRRVSMVWKGGSVRGGGGRTRGRGAGGRNPFANGRRGHRDCSADGRRGWCWCTWWAYAKRPDVYDNSAGRNGVGYSGWDAKNWAANARRGGGYPVGTHPAVGALVVFPATRTNDAGHIAYVEGVSSDESFTISEYNRHNDGRGPTRRTIQQWQIGSQGLQFIYGGPATGAEYIGHIVQWAGDTKTQKTAWYVINQGGRPRRVWIPTAGMYWCLKSQGAPGPDVLPSAFLSTWLVDLTGVHATCASGEGGGDEPAAPPPSVPPPADPDPSPTPPYPSPPRTWREQQGHHGVNTFTNHHNASGLGPRIAPAQWVQVSCKVHDGTIASVNPDGYWYRIASSPWNNRYYAPANTFMNGDPWNGPYTHNTDWTVPNC